MKNAIKTVIFIVIYYLLVWLRNILSLRIVVFCGNIINLDSFIGCLIFFAIVGSIVSGILWFGTMLLAGGLLQTKIVALIGFIFAAIIEVLDYIRWPLIGGAFYIIYGLILALSSLVGPFANFMARMGEAIAEKEKRAKEDREQLKREIIEEMQNNQGQSN